MKPRRTPILLLGILIAAGSIPLGAETSDPQLLSVRIVPEAVELEGAGDTRQLLVMGRYSDRLERDVTSLSQWDLSNARVAAVSPGGERPGAGRGRHRFDGSHGDSVGHGAAPGQGRGSPAAAELRLGY